ncbi:Lpxtg-motif cell wall anchor domain-containing [Pyrenophora seminiperda CCB06]|uniref:Lpxtg-motif cell wall anchor domain-containing n=1 Tax=Pyrenophora seminiperda CCB06 TaxID=1302712 RepID=A0A3M7M624_9PLEO|nr:Lpxtg-motif cell wall anchor domain-containing [Pyrenophora seminiperda CCB06]
MAQLPTHLETGPAAMPAHHSRNSSGGAPQHHTAQRRNSQSSQSQPATSKPTHLRSNTAPQPPTLLRLPSAPATTARRPPASHSAHGIDNSRGPPVTLVTRSRSSQNPADFVYAQQQFLQSSLVSPSSSHHSTRRRGDDESITSSEAPRPPSQQAKARKLPVASAIPSLGLARPPPGRRNSTSTSRPPARPMASSTDGSSEYDSGPRSRMEDYQAAHSGWGAPAPVTPGTDTEKEDLFLNIAADTAPKQQRPAEATARVERLKSRVARVNSNRQSLPSALHSPSPVQSNSTATPATSRIPVEPRSSALRRSSFLYERSSNSPAPDAAPRTRDLSHKASFTSTRRDSELSPRDFLAQFSSTRRSSQPDVQHTPPSRTPIQPYRPSNLSHEPRTPHVENSHEVGSRADGTESHGSTGPAASVWDELDELKSRIRKIEMGGKIPSTSGAIVSQASQASAERPRTANTSATTVSSSPNQQRKSNLSPSESSVSTQAPPSTNRTHPLLRDALSKVRQHVSPTVYRSLEAAAQEALALAEMSGSGGPQGTLHSASSIINGSVVSDRQVRRKADNLCRSLTELCIAMCDTKTGLSSPAFRSTQATISRRPSVQINGDSPPIRQSIEPESNTLNGVSPSRALSRIEARRTSMLVADSNGSQRGNSQEPYDDRQTPSRLQRSGTSLHRTRQSVDEDEEDPIFRAPSRAMTSIDFRARQTDNNRFSRQYTSREPMPDLQPSPALQSSASLRRPSISSTPSNDRNSLLFRDQSRYGHNLGREGSPVIYDKPMSGGLRARAQLSVARNPNNRHSVGGMSDIGRSVSLGRRLRGNSTGE